ncbi:hypothetical protein JCM10450v2_001486 [Rhodotorula kratochvilovae]
MPGLVTTSAPDASWTQARTRLEFLHDFLAAHKKKSASRINDKLHEMFYLVCQFAVGFTDVLSLVPGLEPFVPIVKVVFWLGIVWVNHGEVKSACTDFMEDLFEGYAQMEELQLRPGHRARRMVNEVMDEFIEAVKSAKIFAAPEPGLRKSLYALGNAFRRDIILGQIDSLQRRLERRQIMGISIESSARAANGAFVLEKCVLANLFLLPSSTLIISLRSYPLPSPPSPSEHAVDRVHELAALIEHLNEHDIKAIGVHGAHGLGKTQLVLRGLEKLRSSGSLRRQVFLRCEELESAEDLARQLFRIRREGLRDDESLEEELAKCLVSQKAIVALDDFDILFMVDQRALKSLLDPLLKLEGRITFVFTTTDESILPPQLPPGFKLITLEPLDPESARKLFVEVAPSVAETPEVEKFIDLRQGNVLSLTVTARRAEAEGGVHTVDASLTLPPRENPELPFADAQQISLHDSLAFAVSSPAVQQSACALGLLALLVQLPRGIMRVRLGTAGPLAEAVSIICDASLAMIEAGTLRLLRPTREYLKHNLSFTSSGKTAGLIASIDAVSHSFALEASTAARHLHPRRMQERLAPPSSPDWPNFLVLLRLAALRGGEESMALLWAFPDLVESLPFAGELATFLGIAQHRLEVQLERLAIAVDDHLSTFERFGMVRSPACQQLKMVLSFISAKQRDNHDGLNAALNEFTAVGANRLAAWARYEICDRLVTAYFRDELSAADAAETLMLELASTLHAAREALDPLLAGLAATLLAYVGRRVFYHSLVASHGSVTGERYHIYATSALDTFKDLGDEAALVRLVRLVQWLARIAVEPDLEAHDGLLVMETDAWERVALCSAVVDAVQEPENRQIAEEYLTAAQQDLKACIAARGTRTRGARSMIEGGKKVYNALKE